MPTYEFNCEKCGEFTLVTLPRPPRTREMDCPKCNGLARLRISGGSAFSFNQPDGVDNPTSRKRKK